jgi:hypothetical protein
MQPYFFPYLGHFALIAAVDEWIVFDVTQYTPKTWMNRNRILHPKEGWQYVSVPLANASIAIKTHEARVVSLTQTLTNLRGKLSAFSRHAPFFKPVSALIESVFDLTSSHSLCELNVNSIRAVCDYLGLPFSYRIGSELNLAYPQPMGPGDWAPFICQALGASEYVNPAGGRELFDVADFKRIGVALTFAEFEALRYNPAPYRYEPHLSIIDVLLWNAPQTVVAALRRQTRLVGAS